jgi:hypothetical protein
MQPRRDLRPSLLALALAAGCTGVIGEPPAPIGTPGSNTEARPGGDPSDPGDPEDPTTPKIEEPAPSVRYARLTHAQWANSVKDLLNLPEAPAIDGLRSDPAQSGFLFDNDADVLEVDQALSSGYQRAAQQLAQTVTQDAALLARLLPQESTDTAARARAFIRTFGKRAHRRPLANAEVEAYFTVYTAGTTLYDGVPAFTAGVRLLIEAFLQSPRFLYRIEQSAIEANGVVPLDGFEIASRLSYFIWNTMPDDSLFQKAEQNELSTKESRNRVAREMLEDPRANELVERFHDRLLNLQKLASIAPAPAVYSGSNRLAEYAKEESRLFIRDVFATEGGLTKLLTSSETFANAELAEIYGLSGSFGEELVPVSLDPSKRRGIFTQVGFLAANATSVQSDPIHRGVFLTKQIACNPLGAPPANIPPLPPPEGRTNRETVASHTETPGSVCAGCHATLINPFGYPFEGYDAVGRTRTEDSGFAVDTTAAPLIGGKNVPVSDAVQLAEELAKSDAVHACYSKHWIELAFGRSDHESDAAIIENLAAASKNGGSIKDLIAAIASSRAFSNRGVEELP